MTHDLKTPTIAQIKALDLLLNDNFGELSYEQKDIINEIKNSCNYMYNLIFTILDSYLFDDGRVNIDKTEFDVKELINSTINEISKLLEDKQQKIAISLDLSSYKIFGDNLQLKRVITNLISNAINYSYPQSTINISVTENDTEFIIDVKNKAKKIPDELLKHIYDKYKPTVLQKAKAGAGSGLGLYLSKQIIDAHNGSLYAMSVEDGNCTFGFTIPKRL